MWNSLQRFHMIHTDFNLSVKSHTWRAIISHGSNWQVYLSLKAGEYSGPWTGPGLCNSQRESTTNSSIKIHHRTNLGKLAIKAPLQGRGLVMTMMTFSPDFCQQEMTWLGHTKVKNRCDFESSLVQCIGKITDITELENFINQQTDDCLAYGME